MTTVWIGAALIAFGVISSAWTGYVNLFFVGAGVLCVLVGLVLRSHKKTRDQMWEADLERRLDAQFGPEGQDD